MIEERLREFFPGLELVKREAGEKIAADLKFPHQGIIYRNYSMRLDGKSLVIVESGKTHQVNNEHFADLGPEYKHDEDLALCNRCGVFQIIQKPLPRELEVFSQLDLKHDPRDYSQIDWERIIDAGHHLNDHSGGSWIVIPSINPAGSALIAIMPQSLPHYIELSGPFYAQINELRR